MIMNYYYYFVIPISLIISYHEIYFRLNKGKYRIDLKDLKVYKSMIVTATIIYLLSLILEIVFKFIYLDLIVLSILLYASYYKFIRYYVDNS